MGDEQDGLAFSGKAAHDLHQFVDLLGCQDRRRLVEDQDLIVTVEHFEDLRALLHTDGDILNEGIRIHVQAVFFRQGHDLFSGLSLAEEAGLGGLDAENDVVED